MKPLVPTRLLLLHYLALFVLAFLRMLRVISVMHLRKADVRVSNRPETTLAFLSTVLPSTFFAVVTISATEMDSMY